MNGLAVKMIQGGIASLLLAVSFSVSASAAPPEAGHRMIGQDRGRVVILGKDQKVEWELPVNFTAHDIQVLKNGNILYPTGSRTLVEVTPDKKTVWQWTSKPVAPYTGSVEIHGFQRLDNGLTMFAETGNKRIIEVNAAGEIVTQTPLTIDRPDSHRDVRMVRKLKSGGYLVCHEGDGVVREYDSKGTVVWKYAVDLDGKPETPGHDGHGTNVFGAIRLKSGNTMIAAGNGNRVIEVNPKGETVWRVDATDLPGVKLCWITSLEMLPNGHLVFGNTHAGPDNPQLIEITHDKAKRVVWMMKNWDTFGNDLCAVQMLDVKGNVIR